MPNRTHPQLRIRSRYLSERVRTHPPSPDNLDVYQDLLRLERLIAERPRGWIEGLSYDHLRHKYAEAFRSMARELAPELVTMHQRQERRWRRTWRLRFKEAEASRKTLLNHLRRIAGDPLTGVRGRRAGP